MTVAATRSTATRPTPSRSSSRTSLAPDARLSEGLRAVAARGTIDVPSQQASAWALFHHETPGLPWHQLSVNRTASLPSCGGADRVSTLLHDGRCPDLAVEILIPVLG